MTIRKPDLDQAVARELGERYEDTSTTTYIFLRRLLEAIATGEVVHLQGFGKFKLVQQGGAPPPHARFGGGHNNEGSGVRFRVHFSKGETLAREVRRLHEEKSHGKVRRRSVR